MMLARPTNNHVVEKKELYTVDIYRSTNKKKKRKKKNIKREKNHRKQKIGEKMKTC